MTPAAQAIADAVSHYETNHWLTPNQVAAAALRVAAAHLGSCNPSDELTRIATELEGLP